MELQSIQFTVIIPTLNRGSMLMNCIDSILRQERVLFEVIVIDDGGTDNTRELVEQLNDSRVRYFYHENRERGTTRNEGLKLSVGDYINYFDSDDLYNVCLHNLWNFIMLNKKPPVVFGSIERMSEDGKNMGKITRLNSGFKTNILYNNFLACGSVFLRRDVAVKNLFSGDRRLSGVEDWELWLRIYSNHDFAECNLTIFRQRYHRFRSLNVSSHNAIIVREKVFIDHINRHKDLLLRRFTKQDLLGLIADRYTFISMTEFAAGNRKSALNYLITSIKFSKRILKRKRFWALLKKLGIPWL